MNGSVPEFGDGTSLEKPLETIQEGIDASSDGDTVIVAQGTYVENIQFKGKNIVLRSSDPLNPIVVENTTIHGGDAGSVVTFAGTENETCLLSGFTIRNGDAESGGGICGGTWESRTHATIENNVITVNLAGTGAGLTYCDGLIRNNTITGNSARGGLWGAGGGGGLAYCNGTIQNNTIAGNSGQGSFAMGGGLLGCNGTIQNNTITDNSAAVGGGLNGCSGAIRNCVIWGNTAPNGPQLFESSIPAYSCIEASAAGGDGNVSYYPYFVDAPGGHYHLLSWSPCIDTGDPTSDFSQEPQPNGGRVDMGAYGNTPEATSRSPDSDADLLPDGWETAFFGGLGEGTDDDSDGDGGSNLYEYHAGASPAWPENSYGVARRLTSHPGADAYPAWSPDGTKVVFASDRSGNADIWVINADGTNPMKLTSHSAGDTSPAWSPDGTRIAFSSDRGGDQDIYVMDCDGGNVKRLAAFPGWDALPAWSPDGKKIAWARGIFSIWVMDGDGGNQRQLVSGMGDVYNPLWSPDGEYIYFNSDVLSYDLFEIWRVRANGTEAPEQVTSDGNNHWRFCLSPVDRAKVVLDLDIGGRSSYVYTVNPEIYVMNADGSDMLNISNHPARDYYPSWSPDGTKGVFYSDRTGNWDIWVVPIAVPSSVAMAPCPDGSASLMWRPFGTKSYTVLYRDNLHRGDWSPVEGMVWPITARFWKDKAVPGVRQRFYRVESH